MSNAAIRDALRDATAYLSQHPKEARYTDSKAIAVLEAGLGVTVTGPSGALVRTDMPESVGGGGSAPSPGWLLRAAQAWAYLAGRPAVLPEDVQAVLPAVVAHRLERSDPAGGGDGDALAREIIRAVPVPP